MIKKIIIFFICLSMLCNFNVYSYGRNEGPSDETQKEIDSINSTLEWRSTAIESEGLYYSDIRELLKSTNLLWDIYDENMKDPEYISWQEEYNYKDRPKYRRIEARDLKIPPYSGSGPKLSAAEYKVATDFSKNYICKSFGDLVFDLWADEADRIYYYQSLGRIQPTEISDSIISGRTGRHIYVGSEELKNLLMTFPLFNKDKLELNESGYYSNYKTFIK